MKKAMQQATRLGAKGIKVAPVAPSGRRRNRLERILSRSGDHPPADHPRRQREYGFAEAATTHGRIGAEGLIYKGEVLNTTSAAAAPEIVPERRDRRDNSRGDRRMAAGGWPNDRGDRRAGGARRWRRPQLQSSGRKQPLMLMPKRVKYRRTRPYDRCRLLRK